jgi:hypothetical protein
MRHRLSSFAIALSLSLATAALAQTGGGAGGGASGGASTTGSGAAPATPPGSVSPRTDDVAGGSRIPRARTETELGVPQPGDPSTTGSIGSSGSSVVAPSTVDRQSERDRALNRSLIEGGGICDGCSTNPPAAR